MRQWRVGTLSMGLLLLAGGLGLLWAQFQPVKVVGAALRWWPLLFIILGLEIVVYTYFQKNEDGPVKYDLASILIIIFLIFTGLGLRAFQEVGLAQYVQKEISSSTFNIPIAQHDMGLDEKVQKLVVSGGRCSHLDIRSIPSSTISIGGKVQVRAQTLEEAQQQAAEVFHPETRQVGDTLFLNINGSGAMEVQVMIPAQLAVEVNAGGGTLSLQGDQISQDWLVRNLGPSEITLPAQADLLLTVMGDSPLQLQGNIQWIKKSPAANVRSKEKTQEVRDGSVNQQTGDGDADIQENEQSPRDYEAQARLGNASHRLTLISVGGQTSIRQLP
ncbi:MAG TPA: hypothetical protein VN426_01490 [Syntrophomonadaceae bacterium]|nr:hypothetical protein [Syntrophomonadaceae bacterium]